MVLLLSDDAARFIPQLAAFGVERLGLVEMRMCQLEVAAVGDFAGATHVILGKVLASQGVARCGNLLVTPLAGLLAGSLPGGQLVCDAAVLFIARRLAAPGGSGRRGG